MTTLVSHAVNLRQDPPGSGLSQVYIPLAAAAEALVFCCPDTSSSSPAFAIAYNGNPFGLLDDDGVLFLDVPFNADFASVRVFTPGRGVPSDEDPLDMCGPCFATDGGYYIDMTVPRPREADHVCDVTYEIDVHDGRPRGTVAIKIKVKIRRLPS